MADDFDDDETYDAGAEGDPSPEALELAVEPPEPNAATPDEGEGGDEGGDAPPPPPKKAKAKRDDDEGGPITREMYDAAVRERDGFRGAVNQLRESQRQFSERMSPILRDWNQRRKVEAALDEIIADHAIPPYEEDPGRHIGERINRAVRPLAEQVSSVEERLRNEYEGKVFNDYQAAVHEDLETARQTIPDFDQGLTYLAQARYDHLKRLYPTAPDHQIEAEIREFSNARARFWVSQGRSPAEGLYYDALEWGYQNQNATNGARKRQGGALAARRAAAATSLNGVGGRGAAASRFTGKEGVGDITAEDIVSMSPAQYARFKAEYGMDAILTAFADEG